MKTFITSQFNYCPLTWMFHNRTLNNKINKLHERVLRLVYDDINLSFQDLLDLDNSMTIHQRNIQKLAIEMYKIKNNLSPIPMKDIFKEYVNTYDLRNKRCWEASKVRTVFSCFFPPVFPVFFLFFVFTPTEFTVTELCDDNVGR